MGAAESTSTLTPRLERLTSHGFSVAECRSALEAADGDVERAEALLTKKRCSASEQEASLGGRELAISSATATWMESNQSSNWGRPELTNVKVATGGDVGQMSRDASLTSAFGSGRQESAMTMVIEPFNADRTLIDNIIIIGVAYIFHQVP